MRVGRDAVRVWSQVGSSLFALNLFGVIRVSLPWEQLLCDHGNHRIRFVSPQLGA